MGRLGRDGCGQRWLLAAAVMSVMAVVSGRALDRDGDGISDIYQDRTPGAAGLPGDADPDEDGANASLERHWRTDPLRFDDRPPLPRLAVLGADGGAVIFCAAPPGAELRVIGSTDLTVWAAVDDVETSAGSAGGEDGILMTVPSGGTGPRFLRVELLGFADADGDGLDGWEEAALGTTDAAADSDGDGWRDSFEYLSGDDPATPFADGGGSGGGSATGLTVYDPPAALPD